MQKLHPNAVWLFFFRFFGISLAIPIVFAVIIGNVIIRLSAIQLSLGWVFWLVGIFLIMWFGFGYGWAKLSYNAYKYELTEDAFKKEHGVIWKKYVSIPYERIQNVDIYRGILARILGLSDLMIQTAGYTGTAARGPEGRLPGVSKEKAEQLREELIRRAKGTRSGV